MKTLRVLVVAPEIDGLPKLAQASELTRLGDAAGIDVDPLIGPLVTLERIQSRLRRNMYDVVLWSGHGQSGRLLLPGGKEAEPRWLASEAHRSGVILVLLSVCDSSQRKGYEGFADVLPGAGISLIGMAAEIDDRAAVDYDVAVLHALVNGDTLRTAHGIGMEAIGHDVASRLAPQLYMADSQVTAELGAQVKRLQDAAAAGNPQEALEIIRQCHVTLSKLQDHYEGLDGRVRAIEHRLNPPWQVTFWRTCALAVAVFGLVLFLAGGIRDVLFAPVWMGATFEAVLGLLAILCWRMADVTMERLR